MIKLLAAFAILVTLAGAIFTAATAFADEEVRHRAELHRLEEQRAAWEFAEQQRATLATQGVRDANAAVGYLAWAVIAALVPSCVVLGALTMLDRYHRGRNAVWPRADGTLPVPRWQLELVAAPALGAFHQAQLARATAPAHYTVKDSPMQQAHNSLLVTQELPGVTDLGQLLSSGFNPSSAGVLLALGQGGRQITAPIGDKLCHVVFAGKTGAGKTNLTRLILVQLLAARCEVYLLDPHFAPVNPSTGEDWRHIAAATAPGRAITDKGEIMLLLEDAAREVDRRLALWHQGKDPGPARFYAVEEAPLLASYDRDFMQKLGRLLREGRKLKLFVITSLQDFLVSTMHTSSGLRAQFQTCYYGGGDPYTAKALLGSGKLPEPPGKGVVYLNAAATAGPELVRIPLVSNEAIERLLAPSNAPRGIASITPWSLPVSLPEPALAVVTSREPEVTTLTEREATVRELLRHGVKFSDVVKQVWGVDGGRAYVAATAELSEIIKKLV